MKHALYIIVLAIALFGARTLWAQNEVVRGLVRDEADAPIALAVVLTVQPQDSSIVAHTVTNTAGVFRIRGEFSGKYWLQVRQMGYITHNVEVTLPLSSPLEIVLRDDPKEIEAVRIAGRRGGMTRKGDTVGYNLKAYATGMEKTLGDVLANLPGVKVTADGQVTAQGKEVSKILFNGRDYFGDNVAMATKNIDAQVADSVKVIQGYSEYDIFRGFRNVDKTVIDVGVKEGMMSNVFGKIEAGGGYKNAYMGRAQVYYMGTNHMFSALVASNNVAENTFTVMDYLAMQGGLQTPDGGFQARFNMDESLTPIVNPPRDTYKTTSHAVNLLYNYHKQNKLKLTAAAMAAKGDNEGKTEQWRTFVVGAQQGTSFRTGSSRYHEVQHALGNFGISYNPTQALMLMAGAMVDFGTSGSRSVYDDYYASKLTNTVVKESERPFTWNIKGGVYYKPNKHLFYIASNALAETKRPITALNASDLYLPLDVLDKDGRYILQFIEKQNISTNNNELGARFKLTDKQDLKVWFANTHIGNKTTSDFEGANPISVLAGFDGETRTDLTFSQNKTDLGVNWRFDDEKHFTWSAELLASYLVQSAKQPQINRTLAGGYITPRLYFRYRMQPNMSLRVELASQVKPQTANSLRYGMQMNSYRSITQNHDYSNLYNRDLYTSMRYRYDPTEKSYSFNASARYTRNESPFSQMNQIGLLSITMPFGVSNSESMKFSVEGANRFAGIWILSLDLDWRYTSADLLYNNTVSRSVSQGPELELEARSSYSSFFNVELGLQGERREHKIGSTPPTIDYYASAKAKLLFEYAAFRAELGGNYSLSAYSDKSPQLFGLDAELAYYVKHGLSVVLVGRNLLNINLREWVDISYSDLFRSERVYQSMPGYAMLKIRWEFGQNRDKTSDRSRRRMERYARHPERPPRG